MRLEARPSKRFRVPRKVSLVWRPSVPPATGRPPHWTSLEGSCARRRLTRVAGRRRRCNAASGLLETVGRRGKRRVQARDQPGARGDTVGARLTHTHPLATPAAAAARGGAPSRGGSGCDSCMHAGVACMLEWRRCRRRRRSGQTPAAAAAAWRAASSRHSRDSGGDPGGRLPVDHLLNPLPTPPSSVCIRAEHPTAGVAGLDWTGDEAGGRRAPQGWRRRLQAYRPPYNRCGPARCERIGQRRKHGEPVLRARCAGSLGASAA
jgi:hypothetical protein